MLSEGLVVSVLLHSAPRQCSKEHAHTSHRAFRLCSTHKYKSHFERPKCVLLILVTLKIYTPVQICHTCTFIGEVFQCHSPKQYYSGIA